jgi:outer membrane lipoprotein SlyB
MNLNTFAVKATVVSVAIALLAGCATGQDLAANSYTAAQVNTRQEAKTVEILAVMPAKITVDNSQNRKAAQTGFAIVGAIAGGILGGKNGAVALGALAGAAGGAIAGGAVSDKNTVNGVSLAYRDNGKVYNSAQVGQQCEYKVGTAIMVATDAFNTRIQPNSTCTEQQAAKS